MRIISPFLCLVLLVAVANAQEPLGYISQSTINVGDDVQTIAAMRFLPPNSVPVDREFISEFNHPTKVKTVVSGWFMHEKGAYWDLPVPPPAKSWPPSPWVDPFFISIHLTGSFHPSVFSQENINYLKLHAPIGARDLYTLDHLQQRGIPSYFSGCLTLTLENHFKERDDIIYLVDIDEASIAYIKSKVTSPVIVLTHGKPILQYLCHEHRLKYTEYLLNRYRKAKCVVTSRLHAAMPCLAFETPILMIHSETPGYVDPRFTGLLNLVRHTSRQELRNGEADFDFNNPPENPREYLAIRENLINLMTEWVEKNWKK